MWLLAMTPILRQRPYCPSWCLSLTPVHPTLFVQGVFHYKGRIWLGNNKPVQSKVLHALHASTVGGHSAALVTYTRIKQLFFWPGLRTDVWAFVQNCATYIQAKPDRSRYPSLLEPLPVLASSFEVITLDFIEGLPQSSSFNAIWVVVDKFSKFSHFVPLKHPFTVASLAKVFMDQIYHLHGMPKVIISD
jgi:hypothetical protein